MRTLTTLTFCLIHIIGVSQFHQGTITGASLGGLITVTETLDKGFIMGSDASTISKVDSTGKLLWSKQIWSVIDTINYPGVISSIIQNNDSSFTISGSTYYSNSLTGTIIGRLDKAGNLLWIRAAKDSAATVQVISATNKGYVLLANLTNSNTIMVIKTDTSGNLKWSKRIGPKDSYLYGYSIIQTSDGGYAISGYDGGISSDSTFVIKLDSTGSIQWAKKIGIGNDYGYNIIQSADGGYIVTGETGSFGPSLNNVSVIKLNPAGNLQWYKALGISATGAYIGYSVWQTKDKGYEILGQDDSAQYSVPYEWPEIVIKLDSVGNFQWGKETASPYYTIGGSNSIGPGEYQNYSSFPITTSDKGFAYTFPGSLIKLDSNFNNECISPTVVRNFTSTNGSGIGNMKINETSSAPLVTGGGADSTFKNLHSHIYCLSITASFTAADTIICQYDTVKFTDKSIGVPTGWEWSFPKGIPAVSALQNPVVTFDTAGTIKAILVVSSGSYSDTVTKIVIVKPVPTLTINGRDTITSGNKDTLIAAGANSYMWTSGPTKDTDIVSPTSNKTYIVTGTSSNGCSVVDSFTVVVKIVTGIGSSLGNHIDTFYPNPGNGVFNIIASGISTTGILKIYNIAGQEVSTSELSKGANTVNLTGQPSGIYLYRIISDDGEQMYNGKLIIE